MNFYLTLPHIFPKVMVANIYVFDAWPHFREFGKFQSMGVVLKAMAKDINCISINVNIKLFLQSLAISIRGMVSLSPVGREINSASVVLRATCV